MVLITSAKYVDAEFQAEFGKIPPTFLPLGNQRLYEHQVQLFTHLKEKIILSLPKSFQMDATDANKFQKLGITQIAVPDNITLGDSIVYCLNMLFPLNEHLIILHGDTYFSKMPPHINFQQDILSVSFSDIGYSWETLNAQYNTLNTPPLKDYPLIFNGLLSVKDPYLLAKSILQCNSSFTEGMKLYSKYHPLHILPNSDWFDFGLLSSYFNSKKRITSQRAFNALTIAENYFIKSSTNSKKIQGEIAWFLQFPKELSTNIPSFLGDRDSSHYKVEYLYLNTLSELFVFGRLQPYVWSKIFQTIYNFLKQLHSRTTKAAINFSYPLKTQARFQTFLLENRLDCDTIWEFEDLKISIPQMLSSINTYITEQNTHSFIHGDFCFSNIMYDFRSNGIKIFDPRGMDFSNQITPYGDKKYDYAKLMHSCIGLYDFIICDCYTLTISKNRIHFAIKTPNNIQEIQERFLKIFHHDTLELYAIMIHIFLSMLPLHADNKTRQWALFANAFRLYQDFCRLRERA